jgi:arginyl-tRNA synthetase
MTLPEPVAAHKNTLFLLFSPVCKPYAELAAWHFCHERIPLKVGLDRNLLAQESRLIIPKGPNAPVRTVLTGKATIARYFARQEPSLYLNNKDKIDGFLETLMLENTQKKTDASKQYVAEAKGLDLGHFVAWDHSIANAVDLGLKDSRLDAVKAQVQSVLSSAPVYDEFKFAVVEQLHKITGADASFIYKNLVESKDKEAFDVGIAMPALKLKGNPAQLAQDLAKQVSPNEYITKVVANGVFLNILYNRQVYQAKVVKQILNQKETYGQNYSGFGNLAVVEFSSPNIAKPFHAGHLRSTIIGNYIKNVLNANGWSTLAMNYLGDWGKQYGLLAVGFDKYGDEKLLQQDPIQHLYEVYVKINVF